MLFVVVILFAVSWLPLQTFSMIMFVYPEIRRDFVYQSSEYNIFVGTYFACHWLSMAHSCLNPLIYCFMNDKFRSDLHDLLCKRRVEFMMAELASKQPSLTSLANLKRRREHQLNASRIGGASGPQVTQISQRPIIGGLSSCKKPAEHQATDERQLAPLKPAAPATGPNGKLLLVRHWNQKGQQESSLFRFAAPQWANPSRNHSDIVELDEEPGERREAARVAFI